MLAQLQSEPCGRNHLLSALTTDVRNRLFPHLELVHLRARTVLQECGRPIYHVYFPTDSILSTQSVTEDGASTGMFVVGNEGLSGMSLCMDAGSMQNRMLVQSAGCAYRLSRSRANEEFERHGEFFKLILRYTQAMITQVAQTAVCNRHHSVEQRLCRWLLLSMDRLSHNRLTLTHECLSSVLGVRRESVSQAAFKLQQLGVIAYSRGVITVAHRPRLESLSCECYGIVKNETDRLLDYITVDDANAAHGSRSERFPLAARAPRRRPTEPSRHPLISAKPLGGGSARELSVVGRVEVSGR